MSTSQARMRTTTTISTSTRTRTRMPSALLPARNVRLPPPQAPPHHHHHHHHDEEEEDSHESHSSHSSYARRHAPADAPPPATSLGPPTLSALAILVLLLVLHALGVALFTRGFLLTRRVLDGVRAEGCERGALGAVSYLPPRPRYLNTSSHSKHKDEEGELDPSWSALTADECALPAELTYDRAVVLIVDALRYDFLAPLSNNISASRHQAGVDGNGNGERGEGEEGQGGARARPYPPHPNQHGHLTFPAHLAHTHPAHALLAHFYADPPTTTLQRIKGLTTGTLPTFVDASANFGGGQRIEEDNWIDQLKRRRGRGRGSPSSRGKEGRLVFAGDDTWMGLFPSVFDSATPFDSFNVHDLDTVDLGVRRVLQPFLDQARVQTKEEKEGKDDWALLLLHNLGLDHAGHRFSSTHPSVKRKLLETDALVRDIVQALAPEPSLQSSSAQGKQPRTLFVLMGDHGMDPQGDHGGDAELEVGAGLFVWSSGRPGGFAGASSARRGGQELLHQHADVLNLLSHNWTLEAAAGADLVPPAHVPFSPLGPPTLTHRSIAQIDLVPTLSLLLGLPIPFNSLGTVVPELFAQGEFDFDGGEGAKGKVDPGRDVLLRALRLNAHQIRRYLRAYSSGSSPEKGPTSSAEGGSSQGGGGGGALGTEVEAELEKLWQAARRADAHFASLAHRHNAASARDQDEVHQARQAAARAYFLFTRAALTRARGVWATFEGRAMGLGLLLLLCACLGSVGVFVEVGREEGAGRALDGRGWVGDDEEEEEEEEEEEGEGTTRTWTKVRGPGTVRLARRVWRRAIRGSLALALPSLAIFVGLELASGAKGAGTAHVINVGSLLRVLEGTLWAGAVGASLGLALLPLSESSLIPRSAPTSTPTSSSRKTGIAALIGPAAVHAALFASNSTILREDYLVLVGLAVVLVAIVRSLLVKVPRSPASASASASTSTPTTSTSGLQTSRRTFVLAKAASLSIGIVLCARAGRYGSLCREEHGPTCVSNFYAVPLASSVPGHSGEEGAEAGRGAGHTLAPHMSVAGGLAAVGEGGATNSVPSILLAYVCAYALPGVLLALLKYARLGSSASASASSSSSSSSLGSGSNTGSRSSLRSDVGIAPRFMRWILRPALLASAGHWAADRLAGDAGASASAAAAAARLAAGGATEGTGVPMVEETTTAQWAASAAIFVGRTSAVLLLVAGVFWVLAPLCIEFRHVEVDAPGGPASSSDSNSKTNGPGAGSTASQPAPPTRKQVQLLGFANAFGSTYLLLLAVLFGFLFLAAQPSGQVTLSLHLVALVLLAELGAEVRAASAAAASTKTTTKEAGDGSDDTAWLSTALALLAHNAFFSTGHQATLSSIQWRTAFVLTRSVVYPWSPALVVLNALGPLAVLPAGGVGLVVLWGVVPRAPVAPPSSSVVDDEEEKEGPTSASALAALRARQLRTKRKASAHMYTLLHLLRAQLALSLYFCALTLGSAAWAAAMRRHLMLYKVWTPRFMLAALAGVGVQVVGAAVGVGVVGAVVLAKGAAMVGSRFR